MARESILDRRVQLNHASSEEEDFESQNDIDESRSEGQDEDSAGSDAEVCIYDPNSMSCANSFPSQIHPKAKMRAQNHHSQILVLERWQRHKNQLVLEKER